MRVGLLLPLNIALAPYLNIYTTLLDEWGVAYDVIYPDKRGMKEKAAHVFDVQTEMDGSKLSKLVYYWRYSRFILRTLRQEHYDKLIVFGPQIAIFIAPYLERHYSGRFVMDYRDLSIEQRFKRTYRRLLNHAAVNVISSPGFKEYLPERDDYVMSHNFDINILRRAMADVRTEPYDLEAEDGRLNVMNIGGIRHFEQNRDIIKALANDDRFRVTFAGEGFGVPPLKAYVKEKGIGNVAFSGYYKKKDEPGIIAHASFINIYYSLAPGTRTAISNRFYNSLIYRKPMIVTRGTTQGDYAERHGVGVVITSTEGLAERLLAYRDGFDSMAYEQQRSQLLAAFHADYKVFESKLRAFVELS